MQYTALLLAASAAVASAQATYDPTTGKYICPADNPNGAFCAGDSLGTNIIIRCTNGVGQPGNCNDNLAGFFPFGVSGATCWQSSPTSGIAACAKNCIVEGSSGTLNGTLTLPNCTPVPSPSSSSTTAEPTTTITYINPGSSSTAEPTTTITYINPGSGYSTSTYVHPHPNTTSTYVNPPTGTTTITSTGTTTCTTEGTTTTKTFTTTYCPPTTSYTPTTLATLTSTFIQPNGTGSSPSGQPSGSTNGTVPTTKPTSGGTATATPVGPSVTPSSPAFTGGAMTNSAGAGLAAIGLFIAYFL